MRRIESDSGETRLNLTELGLTELPPEIGQLQSLTALDLNDNQLTGLPREIGQLQSLTDLFLNNNQLTGLPREIGQLQSLSYLPLSGNPLGSELAAAHAEGLDAVMRYLRAQAEAQVVLNEAKLILIGEGEVGKSCLLAALRGDAWEEGRDTTHGIEIKPLIVTHPDTGTEFTLHGWDFGGQKVYRPTHQLFFSSPAVYLIVWKPREGPQQGFVKEWIKLVKHREPDAKILVVSTHGGPGERQPDIDKQEMWDLFGKDTIVDFLSVESMPDPETDESHGVAELKDAIARVVAGLDEVGRTVPGRWQSVWSALEETDAAYLPLEDVESLCLENGMDADETGDFVRISHRLGNLIHYEHDPALSDIVVLKPDWLATAISYVFDDKKTRDRQGLVDFARLSHVWNDPARPADKRYKADLHPLFVSLMERYDISYKVADPFRPADTPPTSLIAQLVPDIRPDVIPNWPDEPGEGEGQQAQICEIVDSARGQSATAEGLFYQLIVRLHRYSAGRINHKDSVHWQRGLLLDYGYNGRALLEHVGNDVHITVRAAYPEFFLSILTNEVKGPVENYWAGLTCKVMVPCVDPCGGEGPGTSLFDVGVLIENKAHQHHEYLCGHCRRWLDIDSLLRNAPTARKAPAGEVLDELLAMLKDEFAGVHERLVTHQGEALRRFDHLDQAEQRFVSRIDDSFNDLIQTLTDEAKEGPRLFSFVPAEPGFFDKPKWVSEKFRLTLWCEHSRLPLPTLNEGDQRGVYELGIPREWFVKSAPFLKVLAGTLSLVAPVAASVTKLALAEGTYKGIADQLDLGTKSLEAAIKGGGQVGSWLGHRDAPDLEHGHEVDARGAGLRQLHAWLKEKDPGFGGLVRVLNDKREFLWVHPQFEKEY